MNFHPRVNAADGRGTQVQQAGSGCAHKHNFVFKGLGGDFFFNQVNGREVGEGLGRTFVGHVKVGLLVYWQKALAHLQVLQCPRITAGRQRGDTRKPHRLARGGVLQGPVKPRGSQR